MATPKVGKDCSVKLGTATVTLQGTWSMDGVQTDEFDGSSFGDEWKPYFYGMKDGGTVSFNGFYDPADTTGQQALFAANLYNSDVITLRLYIDNTSYLIPNQTTGYFSPYLTTGAPTQKGSVKITSYNVGADKSGLMTVSFTGKVNGCHMALV